MALPKHVDTLVDTLPALPALPKTLSPRLSALAGPFVTATTATTSTIAIATEDIDTLDTPIPSTSLPIPSTSCHSNDNPASSNVHSLISVEQSEPSAPSLPIPSTFTTTNAVYAAAAAASVVVLAIANSARRSMVLRRTGAPHVRSPPGFILSLVFHRTRTLLAVSIAFGCMLVAWTHVQSCRSFMLRQRQNRLWRLLSSLRTLIKPISDSLNGLDGPNSFDSTEHGVPPLSPCQNRDTMNTHASTSFSWQSPTSRSSQPKKSLTISTRNLLFWNPSPDVDAPNFAFKESMLATLVEILKSQIYEVTTITLVKSDAEEEQVRQLLLDEAHGLVQLGLDARRVLFCSTIQGGVYIVQHVCPDVHVDFRASSICDLATWVPQLVLVRQSQRGDHALGKVMVGTIADGSVLDDNIRKAYLPKIPKSLDFGGSNMKSLCGKSGVLSTSHFPLDVPRSIQHSSTLPMSDDSFGQLKLDRPVLMDGLDGYSETSDDRDVGWYSNVKVIGSLSQFK
ncbi:hypothetical protein BASA61_008136 [Batrachochytrium salamandrivorans]|nr:hypothetical protein BASA61_008136 [Batrachochytrium salamandrivorans]